MLGLVPGWLGRTATEEHAHRTRRFRTNGPSFTINSTTGRTRLAHGLVFDTSNSNPIIVTASWSQSSRPALVATLAGYTM